MVNDTTTLNGALMELGETMAENISSKGVSASANDGLTTLAGKILKIPSEYLVYGTDVNGYISGTGLTKSLTSTDCVIENTNSSTRYFSILYDCYTATSATSARCYSDGDYVFECDISAYTGGSMQISASTNVIRNLSALATAPFHLKIVCIDGVFEYFVDNTSSYTSGTINISAGFGYRFGLPTNTSITFKNVKIYEI